MQKKDSGDTGASVVFLFPTLVLSRSGDEYVLRPFYRPPLLKNFYLYVLKIHARKRKDAENKSRQYFYNLSLIIE